MTGKMLPGCQHAVVLEAADECGTHIPNKSWVFAKGPNADNGVRRVVVHVQYRRERDLNPKGSSLARGDSTLLVGECGIACGSKSHLRREDGRSAEVDVVG